MKQCHLCGNKYDLRLRYCPVDGTALSSVSLKPIGHIRTPLNLNYPSVSQSSSPQVGHQLPTSEDNALEATITEHTEVPDRLDTGKLTTDFSGQIINNTYRIECKIGDGGMGAVYKATHLKIGDLVAIKFIAEDFATIPTLVARFQREALAARKIAHPDAVTVYEMGETDTGIVFIVMQYVQGERVDHYLKRASPLPPRRILHLLRCIADVLDIAHRVGIVHRDLKPANLIIYENSRGEERVKVLDFGIVKIADGGEGLEELIHLTQIGDIFGSPYYMSPEQALGNTVDARSDIYSLAVIAYQMITGHLPFEGQTGREVIDKVLSAEPTPPSKFINYEIDYDNTILKALAKSPDQRHSNVRQFISELEVAYINFHSGQYQPQTLEPAVTDQFETTVNSITSNRISSLETTEMNLGRSVDPFSRPHDDRLTLAILPLRCLSPDEQTQILSVGLADTLINELAIVRNLVVRPIRSVMKYENTELSLPMLGQFLGVQFIIDGSIQTFGHRMRLSFRLVDTNLDQDIWQDRFEVTETDPFKIQDIVVKHILEKLRINLTDYEKERLVNTAQVTNDAQEFYLRGRYFFERAIEFHDLEIARKMFERAIELDPNFARAYNGLAQCHYFLQSAFGDQNDPHFALAEAACQKALALTPLLAEPYATLADIYMDTNRRLEVPPLIKQSLLLSPNNLSATLCLGWYYRASGELHKAASAYKQAMHQDPTHWRCYWGMSLTNFYQGHLEDAELVADNYLRSFDLRHPLLLFLKGLLLLYKDQAEESNAIAVRLQRAAPNLACGYILAAQVAAMQKDTYQVQQHLNNIRNAFSPREEVFYWHSQIYARCQMLPTALEYLQKSIDEGNKNFRWFVKDPALENLHSNPQFHQLLHSASKAVS